jgi:hypothetical protein
MITSVARSVRLRSVDTNPIMLPTRYWAADPIGVRATDAERFAKCATVLTELYSRGLDNGPAVPAATSWVRFIPSDDGDPPPFSADPASQDLGLGEVHEVPFDPRALDLPDDRRRRVVLDWLHDNMLALAEHRGWPTGPLSAARDACLRAGCRFAGAGEAKFNRGRTHRAHIEYEIDGNGDAWTRAVITDREDAPVATSERYDAFPAARPLHRATRTLRWDGPAVTWTSWASNLLPNRHKDLVAPRRLTMP